MDTTRLSNFKPFNDLKSVYFFTILSTDENCCFLNMKISIKKEINHESISDDKKKDLRKPSRVKIESMLVNDSKGSITSSKSVIQLLHKAPKWLGTLKKF